jgi:hypothetical protein
MPAAADQEGMGHEPNKDTRSTGPSDHRHPPMQYQQWHAVADPMAPDRYTVYAEDERVVCQTQGTWSRGPNDDEREAVVQLIAQAPDIRLALFNLEALVTGVISVGKWPEGTSPETLPPQVIEAQRILKNLRKLDAQ